jgi:hypothetical protein
MPNRAPAGWKPEQQRECGFLAIRVFPPNFEAAQRIDYCESAWEPTPAELEMLNNGGSIILRVVGWQPPVALYVEPLLV